MRHSLIIVAGLLLISALARAGDPGPEALRQRPIATDGGKVGDLLRRWWREGTAAGNVGDRYDNRDGDHSPLDLKRFPQLGAIKYSPDDVKLRKHWAGQQVLLPGVVFGNSSTSAPAEQGGSNPRRYYTSAHGLGFLHDQYTNNNLYIYPEHRDHDPGHNGRGDGFGDLYPTNTPYLIISQGSSGSDQPFMRAVPYTLAAFRPEVKKQLAASGQLMPAIQMILRRTSKHLKSPDDYLTGKAHPTVFDGSAVDDLAMIQLAHSLELKTLPPVVGLKVLEEDHPTPGVDFCEPAATAEVLATTPAVIARIFRGKAQSRRLVVSAESSVDPNGAPLRFTWVVLRGEAGRITIRPKGERGAVAEIVVPYHARRPIAAGSAMASNRVDLGVFAHNGTHYSAPAFITFYSLDSEARTYDDRGRVVEIGHGVGEPTFTVSDWPALLDRLATDDALASRLKLDLGWRKAVAQLAVESRPLAAAVEAAQARGEAGRKELDKARFAVYEFATKRRDALAGPLREAIDTIFGRAVRDPDFRSHLRQHAETARSGEKGKRIDAALKSLAHWGLVSADDGWPTLKDRTTWTAFEEAKLDQFHAGLLAELTFPGLLQAGYRRNFVDYRLTAPRDWRDVYRYGPAGEFLGWTRHGADGKTEYNHDGLLVVEKDTQGRCVKARPVRYVQPPNQQPWANTNLLKAVPGEGTVRYTFAGPEDLRGKRADSP